MKKIIVILTAIVTVLFFNISVFASQAPISSDSTFAKEDTKTALKENVKSEKKETNEEEEVPDVDPENKLQGEFNTTGRFINNGSRNAKFLEYQDVPSASGNIWLRYKSNSGHYYELTGKGITQNDQQYDFTFGNYGKFRAKFAFDETPHRFAFDGQSIYGGMGTGRLTVPGATQTYLQASTSTANAAVRLQSIFNTSAAPFDLELVRKKWGMDFNVMEFHPFNLGVQLNWEKREGTRPFNASFGFGNTSEVHEPINYDTVDGSITAKLAEKNYYLAGSYAFSVFRNNIDTLIWDNPFRAVDSTNASSYAHTYQSGSSHGLIDLYPNNNYHNFTLNGSLADLPGNSKFYANFSWGTMQQNDPLQPYTVNTAIKMTNVAGTPTASDPVNLPVRSVDAKVNTSLSHLLFTSHPLDFMNLRASYRSYQYENKTPIIEFPGYARFDGNWSAATSTSPVENEPFSYRKTTTSVSTDFKVLDHTNLSLTYSNDQMHRRHREVERSDENSFKASIDTHPVSWFDFRTSYERATRKGDYDYTVPFSGQTVVSQLPFLRKYDQANRDRNKTQFLTTFYPSDNLTVSGSYSTTTNNFKDSPFGRTKDSINLWGIDVDYSPIAALNLFAFYNYETYKMTEKARQWTPGGLGNPYTIDTGYDSLSNWSADTKDKTTTIGAGLKYEFKPEVFNFDANYSYAETKGRIDYFTLLGTAANDLNYLQPVPFNDVDTTRLTTLNAKFNYVFNKNLSASLGYMAQNFKIKDYNLTGFTNIPINGTTSAYQGALLMDTLLKNYNVNIIYTTLNWRF